MSRFNDPAHLPQPIRWPEKRDEDEAYERELDIEAEENERRQQQVNDEVNE